MMGENLDPPHQRTFSFNAIAGRGAQTGHAELNDRIKGGRSNFELDCVRYFPVQNLLFLGGVVTNNSRGAPPVGQRAIMAVRDNGGAGPEEITPVGLVPPFPACGVADEDFAAFVAQFLMPITHGNIHIKLSE